MHFYLQGIFCILALERICVHPPMLGKLLHVEEKTTYTQSGITYCAGSFWTTQQRQAHRLHEISYRACFKPQLPAFFIDKLTQVNDIVYDPFMGRGTTVLQAALMQRSPIGNDLNPLGSMLIAPRLAPPTTTQVEERLAQVPWDATAHVPAATQELLVFFHEKTLIALLNLRTYLLQREKEKTLDGIDAWIRMVALNRLTGHSVGFFSVYTLPPNQAISLERQRHLNQLHDRIPMERDVPAIILKKTRRLLHAPLPFTSCPSTLLTNPAQHTPQIAHASVHLIVTSPPFLNVVQYADDHWLRAWFANIDLQNLPLAMHKKPSDWVIFVQKCFVEFARVLKPKGYVAFEVGEVRNGRVLLEQQVHEATMGMPFDFIGVVLNQQRFTKTANCWGVTNNSRGTNTNRIVLLQRH